VTETAFSETETDSTDTEKPREGVAETLIRQQLDEDLGNRRLPGKLLDRITHAIDDEADDPEADCKGQELRALLDAQGFKLEPLMAGITRLCRDLK
jgi:hypothetical protein